MRLLEIVLYNVCILFSFFSFGRIYSKITNQNFSIAISFIKGFLFENCCFFLIAMPFMLLKLAFIPLYYIFGGLVIASIVYGIYDVYIYLFKKKYLITWFINYKKNFDVIYIIWIVIIVGILFQLYFVAFLQHVDIDDSFYLAESTTAISSNSVQKIDPASGIDSFSFTNQYRFVSFELLIAFWAKLLHINVAFLCHTILPVALLIVHYVVIYLIGKAISSEKAFIFVIISILTNVFSLQFDYWQTYFTIARIWQGKSVLISLIIPCLLFLFIETDNKIEKKDIFDFTVCLFAGMSVSTVGVYILPIMYFALVMSKIVSDRNFKAFIKMCIPIIILMPFVLIKAYSLLSEGNTGKSIVDKVTSSSIEQTTYERLLFNDFFDKNIYVFGLYILSLIILVIWANDKIKKYFLYPNIVLFLTFLNPALMSVVSEKITGIPVYWRLFWLLNIPFVFATAMITLFINDRKECRFLKYIFLSIFITIQVSQGQYIFSEEAFSKSENKYKINNCSVNIVDSVLKDSSKKPILLVPEEMSYYIRMYSGDVMIPVNRYTEYNYSINGMEKEYNDLVKKLITPLYVERQIECEELKEQLKVNGIQYFFVYKDMPNIEKLKSEFNVVYEEESFLILVLI